MFINCSGAIFWRRMIESGFYCFIRVSMSLGDVTTCFFSTLNGRACRTVVMCYILIFSLQTFSQTHQPPFRYPLGAPLILAVYYIFCIVLYSMLCYAYATKLIISVRLCSPGSLVEIKS